MTTKYTIRNVFDKERDPLRKLNTIIQVKDFSPISIWTEFEEFVLTDSLLKYLKQFCEHFTISIEFDDPVKPFWLEGFYGSGKSHFSKMIGYLFQNTDLSDSNDKKWKSIDFFVEHILKEFQVDSREAKKWKAYLLETLPLFPKQFNCKSLFIDLSDYSKSETSEVTFMESFTIALLKEFNKSLGLAESIEFAEVEKNMIREGIFEEFKIKVQETQDESWVEVRKSGPWARRTFITVYSSLTNCDKIEASEYINGAKSDCEQKTADGVLQEINQWVNDNLSQPELGIQGKFLVILDEAGLFFSAKASRIGEMMSVTQWIQNRVSKSCINMIFNAQQKIRTYLDSAKADVDYRTAEQRFTPWFLDKKNIKTVVVKRWLKKDEQFGTQQLIPWINAEFPKIIDGSWLDTIIDPNLEYKKPTREDIYETYPFLPYQFPLMIQITQKLISEKIVEEQYGGKTRSILSMTRDVLNNSLPYTELSHFVDEQMGGFVTLPQVYDCITYTLKNKEEDQFLLVNSTQNIVEDPKEFTEEERNLPFSYYEVMKTILLLKHVREIYSSDQNIARALFNSIDCDKTLILQKVKKLIDILKKNGNISYHKRDVEIEEGKMKEIWEYKIASQEEKKWIQKTQHVHIHDQDVAKRLMTFFNKGEGSKLINLRDALNVNKLLDAVGNEYTISNSVRLKCVWEIDPKWDSVEKTFQDLTHQISEMATDSILLIILSPKTLKEHSASLDSLERKIQLIAAKAIQKQKLILFICPSFSSSIDDINAKYRFIDGCLRECEKIEQTTIKDPNIPGGIKQSFNQRIQEIENDVLRVFQELYNEGAIYYGKKERLRISTDNIDVKILQIAKDLFSQVNHKAYLGQIKPSSTEIEKILKFDPKKKSTIPPVFRKSSKSPTEVLYFFNEEGSVLQPHYAEQIQSISHEFQAQLQQTPSNDSVSGENLKNIFSHPPYNWKMQTILACIAGLLRHNQWDAIKRGAVLNPENKEIITAFKEVKSDYADFRSLHFKIAERLSQEEMTTANDILHQLFNRGISKIGPEGLNEQITKLASELKELVIKVQDEMPKLQIPVDIVDEMSLLEQRISKVTKIPRIVGRIKKLLAIFQGYLQNAEDLSQFLNMKKIMYRIGELKQNNLLNRYYWLDDFLRKTMTDWLASNKSNANIDYSNLSSSLLNQIQQLQNPECLFEEQWADIWSKTKKLWDLYWNEYWTLHNSLQVEITEKIHELSTHPNYSRISEPQKEGFKEIFICDPSTDVPDSLQNNEFTCASCQNTFSRLEVIKLKDIESRFQEFKKQLEKEGKNIPENHKEPVVIKPDSVKKTPEPNGKKAESSEKTIKEKREFIIHTIEQESDIVINQIYQNLLDLTKNKKK